jgi:hypothetical protein
MNENTGSGGEKACVVAIDVDKRQAYIFESDKLREMLGASLIIDGTRKKSTGTPHKPGLFAEDGLYLFAPVSGEIRAWARTGDRDKLLDAAWRLRQWLQDCGVEHTLAYLETDLNDFIAGSGDLRGVYRKIGDRIGQHKNAKPGADARPRCSLFAHCQIHGLDAANRWAPGSDKDDERRRELVGFRARAKFKAWDNGRQGFYEELLKTPIVRRLHDLGDSRRADVETRGITFSDLSDSEEESERSDQYVAFLCADGDGTGQLLTALDWNCGSWTNKDPWERNRDFSVALDGCIRGALAHAVANVVFPSPDSVDKRLEWDATKGRYRVRLPLLPQICGGEDTWIVCERESALGLATDFASKYAELTENDATIAEACRVAAISAPLTLSIGIAFAKAGYPAHAMVEAAHSLLCSAKARRKLRDALQRCPTARLEGGINVVQGCIDWHWIESSLSEPVKDARAASMVYADNCGAEMHLTTRPWTITESQKCREAAKQLQRIPRRKREQLETILRLGYQLSLLAWESWWNHLREREQKQIRCVNNILGDPLSVPDIDRSPWRAFERESDGKQVTFAYSTPFLDLLALQHVFGWEGKRLPQAQEQTAGEQAAEVVNA